MADKYYGHHPSPVIPDPDDYYPKGEVYTKTETETLVATVSASINQHSELQDLVAPFDDHTQYAHIDGRRAFTNPVSGVDPTADEHLTTRSWVDSFVATVSAATLDEADNGWYKESFTMTTTTSGTSARPVAIVFDEHSLFVKVHVVAFETMAISGDSGAWHLEGLFHKSGPLPATQVGVTVAVFEQKTNPVWDADFQLQGISNEIVELLIEGDLGQTVKWSVTVEWLLGTPY